MRLSVQRWVGEITDGNRHVHLPACADRRGSGEFQRLLASFGAGVPGGPGLPTQTMPTNV
jgi:hypothetical protein